MYVTRLLIGLSFTPCPQFKNGASESPTTKNNRKQGRICPSQVNFSVQCLYCLWVGKWHYFWRWTVSEPKWQCRQAGLENQQLIYIDVYGHRHLNKQTAPWPGLPAFVDTSSYVTSHHQTSFNPLYGASVLICPWIECHCLCSGRPA